MLILRLDNFDGYTIQTDAKMMRNIIYGGKSNDLQKYCKWANCQKQIEYNELKTGENDPSISQKMKYARYVRGPVGKCSKILEPNGNIIG